MSVDKAPPSLYALVENLVNEFHAEDLGDVKFDVLLVYATRDKQGMAKGPALKNNYGIPVESTVKITNAGSRALGHGDVEIKLDGDIYKDADADKQSEMVDAALSQISRSIDEEEGTPEVDDHGRPKLRRTPPDVFIALYWGSVERNDEHSKELASAMSLVEDLKMKGYLNEDGSAAVGGEDGEGDEEPSSEE